jgi:hypothetical protein
VTLACLRTPRAWRLGSLGIVVSDRRSTCFDAAAIITYQTTVAVLHQDLYYDNAVRLPGSVAVRVSLSVSECCDRHTLVYASTVS